MYPTCTPWGCDVTYHVLKVYRENKFSPRGLPGVFVGYDDNNDKYYRVLTLDKIQVKTMKDVIFHDDRFDNMKQLKRIMAATDDGDMPLDIQSALVNDPGNYLDDDDITEEKMAAMFGDDDKENDEKMNDDMIEDSSNEKNDSDSTMMMRRDATASDTAITTRARHGPTRSQKKTDDAEHEETMKTTAVKQDTAEGRLGDGS